MTKKKNTDNKTKTYRGDFYAATAKPGSTEAALLRAMRRGANASRLNPK